MLRLLRESSNISSREYDTGQLSKSLLFMDHYGTHVREDVVNMLKNSYGTECSFVPKRLTSVLQPLDVVVNAPFKCYMRELWSEWMADDSKIEWTRGGNRKVPSYPEIVRMTSVAAKMLSADLVKKSFSACGIGSDGTKIPECDLHSRLRVLRVDENADLLNSDSEHESDMDEEVVPVDEGGEAFVEASDDEQEEKKE